MRLALCAALLAITLRSSALADADNGDEAEPRVVDPRVVETVLSSFQENYNSLGPEGQNEFGKCFQLFDPSRPSERAGL